MAIVVTPSTRRVNVCVRLQQATADKLRARPEGLTSAIERAVATCYGMHPIKPLAVLSKKKRNEK